MKRFKIEITETLQRVVEVESEDLSSALEEVRENYYNGEIVLDSSDFVETEFTEYENEWEEEHTRVCTECGERFTEGYCIENGLEYYCGSECLHKHYSDEEYEELYDNGNGDSYWTSWV